MKPLQGLRKQAGLTLVEAAERAGIRPATLSSLENGHSQPRQATLKALAAVYGVPPQDLKRMLTAAVVDAEIDVPVDANVGAAGTAQLGWSFLAGLDLDIRRALLAQLRAVWTHTSTALEGNTLSLGDTQYILSEGMTVSGHSLREHAEIHGHGQALEVMTEVLAARRGPTLSELHEMHGLIQTNVVRDIFAPIGKFKVEPNGTRSLRSNGASRWHEYARPEHVSDLMRMFLATLDGVCRHTPADFVACYTHIHLGFTAIHPYADGNGRLARILASMPLLSGGQPPLLIQQQDRRKYLELLGDFSAWRGAPRPGEDLVGQHASVSALEEFFSHQWQMSRDIVADAHQQQATRADQNAG